MTNHERECARAESIVRAIIDDLNGRADYHREILDFEPTKKLCVGVLTPPPPEGEPASFSRSRRKPDSLGFDARILAEAGSNTISGTIDLKFIVYSRVLPTLAEQRQKLTGSGKQQLRSKYRRNEVVINDLPFSVVAPPAGGVEPAELHAANARITRACRKAADDAKDAADYWPSKDRNVAVERDALNDETSYRAALPQTVPEVPGWDGKIEILCASTSDGHRISLLFSNTSKLSEEGAQPPQFFDVSVVMHLASGRLQSKPFIAAAMDYRYSTSTYGRGINAVLEVDKSETIAGAVTTPLYHQPRIASRQIGDAATPQALSDDRVFASLGAIEASLEEYEKRWEAFIVGHADPNVRQSSQRDLDHFRAEITTFHLGITALREDDRLLRAFTLMNETAAQRHIAQWRLFQIVFIVSMIPSLLARERPDDKRWATELRNADVLWFPTGGGKTEAYFGIIVTAMFYDRIRGKNRGTTAWLRYPLRMLSIQQLQRLVEFVVTADDIRNSRGIEGDPFTVGYYVGSANTPNYLSKKNGKNQITELKENLARGSDSPRVLQKCPSCSSLDIDVDIRDDVQTLRILHVCKACGRQAPIYIADTEIYRYLPTVLVGTVDRLARAGQTGLFAHLFGQVESECPQHGFASFGTCVEFGCKLTKSKFKKAQPIHDPTPALLLQDELHLLKESLGTYDAHFEGYVDEQARSVGTALPPKRLAATATIEGYDRHVRQLYDRPARRFPSKGIELLDTAYTEADSESPLGRIYCGILPLGPTTDEVCVRIAEIVHYAAEHAWNDSPNAPDNGFYDLTLLYGNMKDGVTSMTAELQDRQGRDFARNLSGEHSLDQVREAIDTIEADAGRPYANRLKTVVATSIISHGVDLERMNAMAFSGFPGRAADYIQASSRVGRKHVGIVFTVYNSVYAIDRSAYSHFGEYHERLYQLVQPVPVNKFSQSAVKRTFSGLYSATMLNVVSRRIGSNLDRGNSVVMAFQRGDVSDAEMQESLLRSYGVGNIVDDEVRRTYRDLIERRVLRARESIEMHEGSYTSERLSPSPVSSLRQVQEQIPFFVDMRETTIVEMVSRGKQ